MPGNAITTASSLKCPHGGTVTIVSANKVVLADGASVALATDTFTIAGCPFTITVGPATVPSPCIKVQWTLTDLQAGAGGNPTLSTTSVGLCLAATQVPQGPVVISMTQAKVITQ